VKSHSNCRSDPGLLTMYDNALRTPAERMLSSIIAASLLLGKDAGKSTFAALGIPKGPHSSVRFQCEIETMNSSLDCSHIYLPMGSFGEIGLAWSYDELLIRLSPSYFWEHATDGRYIHLGITL
jgi:hypothetical protein